MPERHPFRYPPAHPDGHLRLVETVLSGIPPGRRRAEWISARLPFTSLLFGLGRTMPGLGRAEPRT